MDQRISADNSTCTVGPLVNGVTRVVTFQLRDALCKNIYGSRAVFMYLCDDAEGRDLGDVPVALEVASPLIVIDGAVNVTITYEGGNLTIDLGFISEVVTGVTGLYNRRLAMACETGAIVSEPLALPGE